MQALHTGEKEGRELERCVGVGSQCCGFPGGHWAHFTKETDQMTWL